MLNDKCWQKGGFSHIPTSIEQVHVGACDKDVVKKTEKVQQSPFFSHSPS